MLAKAPNRKRAVAYLAASGAVPIAVIERDGVRNIRTGTTTTGRTSTTTTARWWITAAMASPVASAARQLAAPAPDLLAPRRRCTALRAQAAQLQQ
jgi:hypothetical protein